jgi:hypothetical protein
MSEYGMKNPEIVMKKTPNGGDYSEFWYLDKSGEVAKTMKDATQFRILEKTNAGDIVQTTYGILNKK